MRTKAILAALSTRGARRRLRRRRRRRRPPPPATSEVPASASAVGRRLHRLPEEAGRLDGRHARAGRHGRGRRPDRRDQRAAEGGLRRSGGGARASLTIAARCGCIALLDRRPGGRSFSCVRRRRRRERRSSPTRDDEVIEVLPAARRRPRRGPAAAPGSSRRGPTMPRSRCASPSAISTRRAQAGDPRFAGLALAALAALARRSDRARRGAADARDAAAVPARVRRRGRAACASCSRGPAQRARRRPG